MKQVIIFSTIFFLAGVISWAQKPEPIPGQYIVFLNESAALPVIKHPGRSFNRLHGSDSVYRKQNITKLKEVRRRRNIAESKVLHEFADVLVGFSVRLTDAEVFALRKDKDVVSVRQDYVVNIGTTEIKQVNNNTKALPQTESCAVTQAGGSSDGSLKYTWIWILDTGIDTTHPDLNVQINTPYMKSFTGEPVNDLHGHGTHVAGIAAAKNNDIGVVGVSAGAKVVPVKVLSNAGVGQTSWFIAGLDHVAMYDIPGDVVNMSFGGGVYLFCDLLIPEYGTAIRNLANVGTWIVMAAGNNGGEARFFLPGCINGGRIITVGAIDCNNNCASFSNFGSNVDYVTVGVNVYSTYKNGTYATLSGTSMATPIVAGILHQLNNYPLSRGVINCKGDNYKIATR